MNESTIQLLTVVIANLSVILWFRKESREDWLRTEALITSMKEEMKDFHERSLKIEMHKNSRDF